MNTKHNPAICCECGHSVAFGSGKFVNRIPVLDSYKDRVKNNRPYPQGEWICDACDHQEA